MSYEFFRIKFGWSSTVKEIEHTVQELKLLFPFQSSNCNIVQTLNEKLKYLFLSSSLSTVEEKNVTMGLRVGVGGNESKEFLNDIFKMYCNYASFMNWKIVDITQPSSGFLKCTVTGKKVYKFLRLEAGIHRVQRVPKTERSGRYHTSTVSVFVIPDIYDELNVQVKDSDIRIDTFRAGGKGGQLVNVTDSAVRVVHIPTGITVSCQQERSQGANKKKENCTGRIEEKSD